ncbi:hypothetical protein HWC29_gp073 [Aeromonas phage 4_4572]|uniref:Uncharacterized protein n=1 Tax=Aeromonas phage 4_4572 TaxID=2588517 RepID=A0A5B9NE66_9CAUD|nr:hypothetical protein HWC29_gp073 [Aeromonas phage 4_4572]QEG09113.1 hypothetical protein [Aeromonas phage 4_4572]
MKPYGHKGSIFGQAFRLENIDRKRPYYDALLRAGKKRARQEGKKQSKAIQED